MMIPQQINAKHNLLALYYFCHSKGIELLLPRIERILEATLIPYHESNENMDWMDVNIRTPHAYRSNVEEVIRCVDFLYKNGAYARAHLADTRRDQVERKIDAYVDGFSEQHKASHEGKSKDIYAIEDWLKGDFQRLVLFNWDLMTMYIHDKEKMKPLFKTSNRSMPAHGGGRWIDREFFQIFGGTIEPVHPHIVALLER